MQRQHRAALGGVDVEHRAQQPGVVDHDVVAEHHRERLAGDVVPRDGDRVAEAQRVALADVVEVGDLVRRLHLAEQLVLAVLLQVELELEVAVEVVLDGALAAAR